MEEEETDEDEDMNEEDELAMKLKNIGCFDNTCNKMKCD